MRDEITLECECGNVWEFKETATSTWLVDGCGGRESIINEETSFICKRCGKEVKPVIDHEEKNDDGKDI